MPAEKKVAPFLWLPVHESLVLGARWWRSFWSLLPLYTNVLCRTSYDSG